MILLVEDNRDDAELTIEALKDAKIKNDIHLVRNGAEALDFLFQRGQYAGVELPQIVLLDLKLPKLNGLEVLRAIRGNPATARLPVIIFTSSKQEQDLVESYRLGATSYIQKPVDFEQFARAVAHLGVYWVVMNQYPTSWEKLVG